MSRDEFAAARYFEPANAAEPGPEQRATLPFSGESEPSPVGNHVFTPISAAKRLRNPPQRNRVPRGGASMPPMRPGQLYGYIPPQQEGQSPPTDPPGSEPAAAAHEAGQTAENPAYLEELKQYQQSYWAQLQSASDPPVPGADISEKHVPSYLRGVDDPLTHAVENPPPVENAYEDFFGGEDPSLYAMPVQGGEAYGPWRLDEPMADFGLEEYGGASRVWLHEDETASWREENIPHPENIAEPEDHPTRQPAAGMRAQGRIGYRGILYRLGKALASQPSAELSPRRLAKVVAYGVVVLLLAFFTIQVGQLVLSLLRNEQEMKAIREEYYALHGVELERRASRVELPPPGVTFPPAPTPQIPVTPNPTPIMAPAGGPQPTPADRQAEMALAAQAPAAAISPRNKATRYEDNPLTNILDAFVEMRKENPDIVGHLTIEGLMDEIVMMRNNTYYLTHNAYGSFSAAGAVFVDEGCSLKNPPENLHLRGQSKMEGRVFAPLRMYSAGGIDFMRRHPLVRLDTLYEEELYVVFAVIETTGVTRSSGDFNYGGYPSFQTDAQMESHVEAARRNSLYEIPIHVLPSDRLLTLSTVSDGLEDSVLVLVARMLRPGETAASVSQALASARPRGAE